jgi:hypothetical protein
MATRKEFAAIWIPWLVIGVMADGCASPATGRREDGPRDRDVAAEQQPQPDERTYRDAAEKFLKFLAEQHQASPSVIQASGKDGIYPVYECMEHGCPDRVLCEDAKAYCHVTHCGKGSCQYCPEPFPDVFKNLALKQWCRFDCLRGSVRVGTVLGFVSALGNVFIGPFGCPDS